MPQVPLPPSLHPDLPLTALAPMQDVTNLKFMRVIAHYGSPDYFFTEYFRVNETSRLNPSILASITENDTGRPVFAQMIGESIPDLVRTAQQLCRYNIAGIDLNMGCPAPRIYRKQAGGGLLKQPAKVDSILGELRQVVNDRPLSVKMRVGFENTDTFYQILDIINRHRIDLLSLHGRTVVDRYHGPVNYDLIAEAVKRVNCPVLIALSVDTQGHFLRLMRQSQTEVELFNLCDRFLLADTTQTLALAPYSGI